MGESGAMRSGPGSVPLPEPDAPLKGQGHQNSLRDYYHYALPLCRHVGWEFRRIISNPFRFDMGGRDWREVYTTSSWGFISNRGWLGLNITVSLILNIYSVYNSIVCCFVYGVQSWLPFLTEWGVLLGAWALLAGMILHIMAWRSYSKPIPELSMLPQAEALPMLGYEQLRASEQYHDEMGLLVPLPGNRAVPAFDPRTSPREFVSITTNIDRGPMKGEKDQALGSGALGTGHDNAAPFSLRKAPPRCIGPDAPWGVTLHLALFNTSLCLSLLITPFYWILLYPSMKDDITHLGYLSHSAPILCLSAAAIGGRFPFPIFMFFYTQMVGIVYSIWVLIVFFFNIGVGGPRIRHGVLYGPLNFKKDPKGAGIFLGVLCCFFPIVTQLIVFFFARKRVLRLHPKPKALLPPPDQLSA